MIFFYFKHILVKNTHTENGLSKAKCDNAFVVYNADQWNMLTELNF